MSDATLLELVRRGKQDAFFMQGAQSTWFGADYTKRPAQTREIRVEPTQGPTMWGTWVEIQLPRVGDILTSVDIRLQMPTWLPPAIAAVNRRQVVEIEGDGPTYARYGWTNSIANYLFKRWILLADNVQIAEGWGDFNAWFPDMETTHMHAPIIHAATGTHDGSERSIQRNAAIPELACRIPIMGCQSRDDVGFPLCAVPGQQLTLRLWLADITELVESGPLRSVPGGVDISGEPVYSVCPQPWGGRRIFVDGVDSGEVTRPIYEVKPPYIYGRYSVVYLDNETREAMRVTPQQILFKQQQREDFIIPNAAWIAGSRWQQRLSIQGFFQALFVGLLADARRRQNKYRDISAPGGGEWLTNLGLSVNSVDRIDFWPPKKFQELANNTQLARDVEVELYYIIFGVNPDGEPAGTCNLSRTQKTILTLELADVPPAEGTRTTYATIMGLSWNLLDIRDGVCSLRFRA